MPPLLRVDGLKTHYFGFGGRRVVKAVDGVSFTVEAGETFGLVGESGCGKTTTCHSIVRLLSSSAQIVAGRVELDGDNLLELSSRQMREVRGRRIASILQDPMASLDPLFSIGNQVGEPAYYHRLLRGRALRRRVTELLAAVRIPSPEKRRREFPHQMSGGMRQRIVGAIAQAGGPRLIIADEPTTNLDVTIQLQYLDLLKELQRASGVALIFVTHNLGIVAKMCDRVAVMYAGKIVEMQSVRGLFYAPRHPYTKALLDSMPRLGTKEPLYAVPGQPPDLRRFPQVAPSTRAAPTRPRAAAARRRPRSAMETTRRAAGWPLRRTRCMPEPLLEVRDLKKHFPVKGVGWWAAQGWVKAVDGISFTVNRGETLGLVGESGCGKTTTSKLVLAAERATAGTIAFEGRNVAQLPHRQLQDYRRKVQVVFQDPYSSLSPRMRVGEIIAEPLHAHEPMSRTEIEARVGELLDLVGLRPDMARLFPHEFSGGQRQRLAIALALSTSARLDCPR